jgi:hypothetical protein
MTQSETVVELVIKFVEAHYYLKSKRKAFSALKGSTNSSGLGLRL